MKLLKFTLEVIWVIIWFFCCIVIAIISTIPFAIGVTTKDLEPTSPMRIKWNKLRARMME